METDSLTTKIHGIWHKFCKWTDDNFNCDPYELSGYGAICKVEEYVKENPDIKIVPCDDAVYSSSIVVLIPHPHHGITVLFIPQNHNKRGFFLYDCHYEKLMEEMKKMK